MAIIKFLYNNLWDASGTTLTPSSEATGFPDTNTQQRWKTRCWRSRSGATSGWGNFVIELGVNDKIDFEETAAAELTATLTAGTYSADTLAAEIEIQLEAAGASDYTISYSDITNKFTLASDRLGGGNTFKILWLSGTNTATSVGTTIGFDITGDDADAASHVADNLRIHSEEWLKVDLGIGTKDIKVLVIKNHNFTAGATLKIQGHTDDVWEGAGIPTVDETLPITTDTIVYFWSSSNDLR